MVVGHHLTFIQDQQGNLYNYTPCPGPTVCGTGLEASLSCLSPAVFLDASSNNFRVQFIRLIYLACLCYWYVTHRVREKEATVF